MRLFPEPRPKPKERKRWPMWDALARMFPAPVTKTEQSDFARTCRELEVGGATPDQIAPACAAWRKKYPKATLTHRVLRAHWSELQPKPKPQAVEEVIPQDLLLAAEEWYRQQDRRRLTPTIIAIQCQGDADRKRRMIVEAYRKAQAESLRWPQKPKVNPPPETPPATQAEEIPW